jgi:hypothetical protein
MDPAIWQKRRFLAYFNVFLSVLSFILFGSDKVPNGFAGYGYTSVNYNAGNKPFWGLP